MTHPATDPRKLQFPSADPQMVARPTLTQWIEKSVDLPVTILSAEAGFGKTSLLAQWASSTSRVPVWYTVDKFDHDWLTFASHLIEAGRTVDPAFGRTAAGDLASLSSGAVHKETVEREIALAFAQLGAATHAGIVLTFDDVHLLEGASEIGGLLSSLVDRADGRFSIAFSGRRRPPVAIGRLRARGQVALLTAKDLAFTESEIRACFLGHGHSEPPNDVVSMLVRKTGGWPALIGLVAASSDGRSPIALRALVQDLSGAHGEMYEFLADEILSHLDPPFISFLTKSSILEELSLGACIALTNSDAREIRGWIETGESMSLIRRHEGAQDPRLAPLVRDFMHARLHTLVDEGEVRAMHLGLADHFAGTDWWTSANHYLQAGESERALAVLEGALSSILAEGRYARAEDLLSRVPGSPTIRRIIRSRRLLQVGATTDAVAEAQSAVQAAEAQGPDYVRLALQNTATLALSAQRYRLARDAIERLAGLAPAPDSVDPGLIEGYLQLMKASTTGNLPQMSHTLEALLKVQRTRGQSHYAAITSLNLAQALVWLDRQGEALDLAREASRLLRVSSQGYEVVSASLVSALAHAINGDWPTSELAMREALTMSHPEGRLEAILEAATVAAWFGPLGLARDILALTTRQGLSPEWAPHWRVVDLWLEDEDAAARHLLASLVGPPHQSSEVGAAFRWELARARAALRVGERDAFAAALTEAERIATLQASPVQLRLASLLRAIANGPGAVCSILSNFDRAHYPLVSVFAGELAQMIPDLPNEIGDTLRGAAAASPQRWLEPLRSLVDSSRVKGAALGAEILVEIGSPDDIGRLRAFDRRSRRMGRSTADDLSRRLAPKVTIDDLGLMSLAVQDQVIEGHELRRKVLGLIGFLASRPRGSATPDQVVDVLWPDQDPVSAMNSLHQTIYYLRRVIEPDYRAGKSVEYIHFSTELIRLDPDLVSCRSWLFRRLVASRPTSQRDVEHILDVYSGKFALDFAYEDWAASYRDHLHAAYLAIVQEAVAGTQFGGDLRWRLWVGQRAISVDPDADVIEAEVVRLYRTLGASAAAAEQYAHYSSVLRDQLGVEPPPLEDL